MKKLQEPYIEFVEMEENDVLSTSGPCDGYSCSAYGDVCTGHAVNSAPPSANPEPTYVDPVDGI